MNDFDSITKDAPGMRDLAHRLLTCKAGEDEISLQVETPAVRVYEKLRATLVEFVGVAGFQSLAFRALILARQECPVLNKVRIAADGTVQGLSEIERAHEFDNDAPGDGGLILIARLLGLLRTFLGEALTFSLLRNAWPGEAFDDRNAENGRKA